MLTVFSLLLLTLQNLIKNGVKSDQPLCKILNWGFLTGSIHFVHSGEGHYFIKTFLGNNGLKCLKNNLTILIQYKYYNSYGMVDFISKLEEPNFNMSEVNLKFFMFLRQDSLFFALWEDYKSYLSSALLVDQLTMKKA